MAILRFRVYWEEDESVYRDIVINHKQTFLELHHAILTSFEFDQKHQATFYRSNDAWKKGRQITLEKYDVPYQTPPLLMAEVSIGSEIKHTNQRFIYRYDFIKEWTFHLEVIGIKKDEDYPDTPKCIRKEGIGPSQYGTEEMLNKRAEEEEDKFLQNKDDMPEGYDEDDLKDEFGEEQTEDHEDS